MIKFCSLLSGSSGNCIFVRCGNTRILIDSGVSAKRICQALSSINEDPHEIDALLVTHEHIDHTRGVGIMSRKFGIPVYANENTWQAIGKSIGEIDIKNIRMFETGEYFDVGDINVKSFPVPHDAAEPAGFNFFCGSRKICIATDIGHMNRSLVYELEKSDIVLIESNHDVEMLKVGPYPWHLKMRILGQNGHLCNEMAGKTVSYLAEKGTSYFVLGHLSKENNFPELAYQTSYNALTEKNIIPGKDVSLSVALRDRTGEVITL